MSNTKNLLDILLSLALVLTLSACGAGSEVSSAVPGTASSQLESRPPPTVETATPQPPPESEAGTTEEAETEEETALRISVKADEKTVIYELNDSQAAKDLYSQLPLSVEVENFSDNEKIFYPPSALDTTDTPLKGSGGAGALCYYAPWADVVMFYGDFSSGSGLYELGHAVFASEQIHAMSGTIEITVATENKQ